MRFSYLICHSNTSSYRDNNLKAIIRYIRSNFKNVEIVVAEQGQYKSEIPDADIHIFNSNVGLFERSKLLNICAKNATNEKLLIGDNDLIVDCNAIRKSFKLLDKFDAINPYNVVMDLPENVTQQYIISNDIGVIGSSGTYRDSIVFAGGMFMINKCKYIKIGGYDEEIIGWGGEDDALTVKILNMLNYSSIRSTSYHLYHDRGINGIPYHSHYDENLRILYKLQNMSKAELESHCEKGSKNFI